MDPRIKRDLTQIIASAPADRLSWLEASTQQSGIRRQAFWEVKAPLDRFQANSTGSQWLIMPGLRGVGKTTVLTQLYLSLPEETPHKFFLSLERIQLLGAEMRDVLAVIEELVGDNLEAVKQPVYLFMDEVQHLENWALGLKTVFDRTPRAFIVCTGSSAIALQSNPDVARRSLTMPIYPLSFVEYVTFRRHYEQLPDIPPPAGLDAKLRQALLGSKDCQSVFLQLQKSRRQVTQYWTNFDKQDYLDDYMRFGNLPFIFKMDNKAYGWRSVDSLLGESLAKDVGSFARTRSAVTAAFPALLRLLSESDTISLQRISKITGFNKRTVMNMLQTLCSTEILNPVHPVGSAYRQVNRPNKYLFTSPAMRLALAMKAGMPGDIPERMSGKLLEDIVGLYLKRSLPSGLLHYDSRSGGADFVAFYLGGDNAAIPIEVGRQKREARQAYQTLQRVKGKYGLVVTDGRLAMDPALKSVFVPLEYFLLL